MNTQTTFSLSATYFRHWTLSWLLFLFISATGLAADLTFTPAVPMVEVGKQITLSVSGTKGEVTWTVAKGQIQGTGTQVTYVAPAQLGLDVVTVLDTNGNMGMLKITILPMYSSENANWEVYTNRDFINKLAYDANTDSLWVATEGGLELRKIETGEVQVYTKKDGLPSTLINALEFDHHGNLWVGTGDGLAKRSTTGQWESITTKNSNLPNNIILSLHVDDRDTLWVGTAGGLASYPLTEATTSSYTFKTDHPGLPVQPVWRIVSDKRGFIYVALGDGSLFFRHYEESNWQEFSFLDTNVKGGIEEILVEPSTGHFWMAYVVEDSENSKGYKEVIKRFNNETETWDRSYDREFTTTSLYSDSKGNLWVGTEEGGLATLIPQEEKWSVVGSGETGVQIDYITAIQEDKHGNMWIGTGSSGGWQAYGLIQRKVDGSWVEMGQSDLPSNVVEEITDDGKGGILVGTLRDAVRRTKEGKWESFDLDPGTFNSIEGIYQDSQGGLWVTSFGEGLFYRNSAGEIKRINKENSNIPSDFVVLYVDSRKNLWVTTPDAGFAKMREDGSFEVFNTTNSGLPSNYNTTLEEDGQGGLWVGTGSWTEINSDLDFIYDDSGHVITHEGQGLTHLNAPGEWGKVLNTGNSQLPDNDITVSLSDNRGGIWIGTPKGLAHYKADGEWEIFKTDSPELPGNRVSGLLTDESGGLWVGMATWFENDEKGLPSFDAAGQPVISSRSGLAYRDAGGKWILFDSHNSGLPDATVVKLHPDGTGGLWIGTRGGGLVHLTFGHKTEVCTQTDAATCQALQTSKRAAIIIAGGGNDAENDLWDATESITAYLYKVLNKRGFDNDEIYYLSPKDWADFNGDGLNDGIVDAPKPERALKPEDVQEALNWAKQKEKLGQPLYIFFVDHGGTGLDKIAQLQLAKLVYFYAPELKAMLDDYQKETGNQVVMVIDACYSGAFVQQLAAPNRAIISSADTNELAKFVDKQGFSRFFAEGLNSGNSFAEAFGNARLKQQKLIGNSTQQTVAGATEGSSKMTQTPQLDDNGDGTFTTDNTAARDGQWLTQVHLNGNFTTGDLTLAVEIADKETLPATLTAGQPLLLKAKAGTASGGVEQVWAVIRPPRMNLVIGPNGTPILAFPRQPLSRNSTDKLLWEAAWDWDKAVYNGDYDITFYAQDNEKNIASSDSVVIKVEGGIDPPPQATVQLQLSKDRYQRGEPFQAQLVEELGWGYDLYAAVVMPSGEILSLKHPNDMAVVNLATNQASPWLEPRKQHQPITLFDLPTLPENWSTGKYYLYGILSPEKANVFETLDKNLWVMDMKSFEIVP